MYHSNNYFLYVHLYVSYIFFFFFFYNYREGTFKFILFQSTYKSNQSKQLFVSKCNGYSGIVLKGPKSLGKSFDCVMSIAPYNVTNYSTHCSMLENTTGAFMKLIKNQNKALPILLSVSLCLQIYHIFEIQLRRCTFRRK